MNRSPAAAMHAPKSLTRIPRRLRPALVVLLCIMLTEAVTPHLQPAGPMLLARVEARMAHTGLDLLSAFDELLEEYIEWHIRIAHDPHLYNQTRVLCWNGSGSSGLGDKIRGLHHAFMLAMETRRFFIVEDVPEFPIRRLLKPGRIRWDTPIPLVGTPMLNWRTSWARGRAGVRRLSQPQFEQRHWQKRIIRLASATFPMYERTVGTAHFRIACRRLRPGNRTDRCGYLGESNMYFNRKIYRALFNFRRAVAKRTADTLAIIPDQYFTAVHARLGGKFRKEGRTKRFQELNMDHNTTADRLLKCADTGMGAVYLATDDEDFKTVFEERARRYGAQVVVSPIRPRHSGTVSLDEIPDALTNTLVEGLVLGKAHTLVTTGSGLATFAAFSGKTKLVLLEECENADKPSSSFLSFFSSSGAT